MPASARGFDPTDHYEVRQDRGWTLRINRKLLAANSIVSSNVFQVVDQQLFQITRVVPEPALSRLREVTLWIEWFNPLNPCSCYHPSADWLRQHDMNPQKAQSVEISNATNFIAWTHEQPWMLLHELAHSYHHRVIGYENKEIKAAYQEALASHRYESVMNYQGRRVRHYALTNEQEYFAECSEAFFGVNDFYPFVRAELKEFDPKTEALLARLWGKN